MLDHDIIVNVNHMFPILILLGFATLLVVIVRNAKSRFTKENGLVQNFWKKVMLTILETMMLLFTLFTLGLIGKQLGPGPTDGWVYVAESAMIIMWPILFTLPVLITYLILSCYIFSGSKPRLWWILPSFLALLTVLSWGIFFFGG